MKQELIGLLRHSFGGLDFWRLSKRWKEIHYNRVADLLLLGHSEHLARIEQLENTLRVNNIPIPNELPPTERVFILWNELQQEKGN